VSTDVQFEVVERPSTQLEELRRWCSARFERAVLLAADLRPPLDQLSEAVVAVRGGVMLGAACRFDGFAISSVTVSCDDRALVLPLLARIITRNCILGVSSSQPLPPELVRLAWSDDPWLAANCVQVSTRRDMAEVVDDPEEVAQFYQEVGVRYWSRQMFEPGRVLVSRAAGRIVASVAVQFVVEERSYAHIGALVTHRSERSNGLATMLLAAMRAHLAGHGIEICGLFADAHEPWLEGFYRKRGFVSRLGAYRFAQLGI
jgi:GNAT superfamily N-acetyltransferase